MAERMHEEWTWGWQFEAACRGTDSALFFAPNYFERREEKASREAKAKTICTRCPAANGLTVPVIRTRSPGMPIFFLPARR